MIAKLESEVGLANLSSVATCRVRARGETQSRGAVGQPVRQSACRGAGWVQKVGRAREGGAHLVRLPSGRHAGQHRQSPSSDVELGEAYIERSDGLLHRAC
jgi:hypothetical protein